VTLSWLLAAAALLLAGGRPAAERRPRHSPARAIRARELSPRALDAVAAVAIGCCCLALLGHGRGLLAAALAAPAGVAGVRHLRRRPGRGRAEPAVPLALDLLAVALQAGQPVERAVLAAAPAAGALADELTRVGRLLQLGADPADAWSSVAADPALGPVAAVAVRSAHSGVRLAVGVEALAADLRARARQRGLARAHRAGVLAAAPLGLCFLPAFVCLGIVPALIGLAGRLLG
jgi:pilus assembly protein TadC